MPQKGQWTFLDAIEESWSWRDTTMMIIISFQFCFTKISLKNICELDASKCWCCRVQCTTFCLSGQRCILLTPVDVVFDIMGIQEFLLLGKSLTFTQHESNEFLLICKMCDFIFWICYDTQKCCNFYKALVGRNICIAMAIEKR